MSWIMADLVRRFYGWKLAKDTRHWGSKNIHNSKDDSGAGKVFSLFGVWP